MKNLTPRMTHILAAVIERYVATGRPVGSKFLFQHGDFGLAPSTLRGELSRLEQLGYLNHPHTSAGRVPTDMGYRFYVDHTMKERRGSLPGPCGGSATRQAAAAPERLERELDEALRDAAGVLASSTGLMALVSAPGGGGSEIRHVEVLQLHPEVVMVVLITASGAIAKKLIEFGEPVDMGLVSWSHGFLNEATRGLDLGSSRLRMRLSDPGLTSAEAFFIDKLAPAFDIGIGTDLYVNGISRLIARLEEDGSSQVKRLTEVLERREEIMALLKGAFAERNIYLRIGRELSRAAMQECSLVAANYGVANRNLGTIGVLGPTRMDYPSVIHDVRSAAWQLSHYVEDIYQ